MGKPTICIGENKDADQLRGAKLIAKLISAFVFATRIVQFLFYLNPKFHASSSFLCLYRPVCVGPVQKPHCWFSHEAAHKYYLLQETLSLIKNNISALDGDLTNLPALRTINCRHNKLTDKGVPNKLFQLEDLSVVVCICFVNFCQ